MAHVYDCNDWLGNWIRALTKPFHKAIWRLLAWVGAQVGDDETLPVVLAFQCLLPAHRCATTKLWRAHALSYFAAKSCDWRRLAWCVFNKLADKAAGQGATSRIVGSATIQLFSQAVIHKLKNPSIRPVVLNTETAETTHDMKIDRKSWKLAGYIWLET